MAHSHQLNRVMRQLLFLLCFTLCWASNASAADAKGVEVTVLAKSGSSWDGKVLPQYTNEKPEITILRIKIPPGAVLPVHKHGVINAAVLLSGELTVVTEGGNVLQLKAGEALVEVVNTWHYGKNAGNAPTEIIVFYAGTIDVPVTVNK